MKMQKINTGDRVIVISGKNKGTVSVILSVKRRSPIKGNLVLVKDVNLVKKHSKQDGIIEKEMLIHVSNVMLYDESTSKRSRVGIRVSKKGKKERFLKVTGKAV